MRASTSHAPNIASAVGVGVGVGGDPGVGDGLGVGVGAAEPPATLWGHVLRANARGAPEESIALRLAVGVAAVAAAHGALREGVTSSSLGTAVLIGLPAAHIFSAWTRTWRGMWLKVLIAIGLFAAVWQFVGSVAGIHGNAAAIQAPLAQLFLLTMALHAWDLPARRDLAFAMVSSLVLIGAAGTLAVSSTFALDLLTWLLAAGVAVVLLHRRELAELRAPTGFAPTSTSTSMLRGKPGARTIGRRAGRAMAPIVVMFVLVAVIAGAAFALLPAAGGARAFTFPLSLPQLHRAPAPGELVNPSLGDQDPAKVSGESVSSSGGGRQSFGYFGFANKLDTAARGRPDDTLVMRVRAAAPAFWRGQSFDHWDGRSWTSTLAPPSPLRGNPPISLPVPDGASLRDERFVQTYYVVKPGPNMIFAASSASELYFADSTVYRLADGSLRAGVLLDRGAVYTVVSRQSAATATGLVAFGVDRFPAAGLSAAEARRYLQLPDSTSDRVRALAHDVTATASSTYAKVQALIAWMGANTQYSLDVAPLPGGVDTVDRFLFDERVGFCEQIGTSLVVLLRSLGVPARLTVGYVPGERNPFTGLFEVRASDAHAWTEVYFPNVGWLPFDPTANVPLAAGEGPSRAGTGALRYLTAHLPSLPRWSRPVMLVSAMASVLLVVVIAIIGEMRRRRARRHAPWVDRWIERLDDAGRRRGRPRQPSESVRVYVDALGLADDELWRSVIAVVERDAFADGHGVTPDDRTVADLVLSMYERGERERERVSSR